MKRGTPEHPKVFDLAEKLSIPRAHAVGILELLWHFTAKYTPQGDIGKYPNTAIAKACLWTKDAAKFVQALLTCGWLEQSDEYRLLVHDWHDHADDLTRKVLNRARLEFLTISHPAEIPEQWKVEEDMAGPKVYIVRTKSSGYLKIGFTEGSISWRIKALQTGSPDPIELVCWFEGTRQQEAQLHKQFASASFGNGEWFTPTPELLEFIQSKIESGSHGESLAADERQTMADDGSPRARGSHSQARARATAAACAARLRPAARDRGGSQIRNTATNGASATTTAAGRPQKSPKPKAMDKSAMRELVKELQEHHIEPGNFDKAVVAAQEAFAEWGGPFERFAGFVRNNFAGWLEVWKARRERQPRCFVPQVAKWFESGEWLAKPSAESRQQNGRKQDSGRELLERMKRGEFDRTEVVK